MKRLMLAFVLASTGMLAHADSGVQYTHGVATLAVTAHDDGNTLVVCDGAGTDVVPVAGHDQSGTCGDIRWYLTPPNQEGPVLFIDSPDGRYRIQL